MISKKVDLSNLNPITENRRSQVVADLTFDFFWLKYHELKEFDMD